MRSGLSKGNIVDTGSMGTGFWRRSPEEELWSGGTREPRRHPGDHQEAPRKHPGCCVTLAKHNITIKSGCAHGRNMSNVRNRQREASSNLKVDQTSVMGRKILPAMHVDLTSSHGTEDMQKGE